MPREYQKSVTIPKKVYEIAEKEADEKGKSVAKHVTDLILENTQEVPASG